MDKGCEFYAWKLVLLTLVAVAVFLTRELSEVDLRVHDMSATASVIQCLENLGMLS